MNSLVKNNRSNSAKATFDKLAPVKAEPPQQQQNASKQPSQLKRTERPWKSRHVRTFIRDFQEIKHIPWYCYVCRANCKNEDLFTRHLEQHGSEFRFIRQVDDSILEEAMFQIRLDYRPDFAKTLVYVKNVSPHPVVLLTMAYLHLPNGQLMTLFESETRVPWAASTTFSLNSSMLSELERNFALILVGRTNSKTEVLEQHYVQVSELSHFLREQLELKKPPIRCSALNCYPVPLVIRELHKSNFSPNSKSAGAKSLLDRLAKYKNDGLSPDNYVEHLNLLNQIEDYHLQVEYSKYIIKKATLVPGISEKFYRLTIDQFAVAPTLLDEECGVKVIIPSEFEPRCFPGTIHKINEDYMVIHMNCPPDPAPTYMVVFELNRLTFQLEYFALSLMDPVGIEKLLFPKPPVEKKIKYDSFEWFSNFVAKNDEQMSAVRNIVNRTAFPAPYILFGPPGTGKTSTIVEAVIQIWKLQPTANVLVSAPSNFACEEFTKRLLEFIPATDVFRFLSKSCEKNILNMDQAVVDISNISSGTYAIPSWHDVYNSRIVVATTTMCGRLAQAKIDPHHFKYIFIDEAGSNKEVSALVPIAGIGTNGKEVTASVVLSGDPKQLGPLVTHKYLHGTVQEVSMLERLMNYSVYVKDPKTMEYNPFVITKLLNNFRSNKYIIEFSSCAFYGGVLRPRGPPFATDWAIGWPVLPRKKCPLFFHSTRGITEKDAHSSSLYNRQEANQVVSYIKTILSEQINGRSVGQADIGVISPYTKQVQYIKALCKDNNWDQVEVGSTEQFQGREKPVILISTVRSETATVGFLKNEKRLNVAITRARALMIIVGNPDTLQRDVTWYSMLRFCVDYGAFTGSEFKLVPPYKQATGEDKGEDC
ncbi:putative helicase MOV-10 [Ochlerotatus camptorhynchus]|uniref:putative helicase MOV-10 n=1 Tax=Ochlerotatus camptorhynchus TaxID=644619 RepID=UPI0031D353B2